MPKYYLSQYELIFCPCMSTLVRVVCVWGGGAFLTEIDGRTFSAVNSRVIAFSNLAEGNKLRISYTKYLKMCIN